MTSTSASFKKAAWTAVAILAAAFALLAASATLPQQAHADAQPIATLTSQGDKSSYDIYTEEQAIEAIESWTSMSFAGTVTVDLKCDWNTKEAGRIEIAKNGKLVLNLHGHMINRGKAGSYDDPWYAEGAGEVIHLLEGSTLTVNGGTGAEASTPHAGSTADEDHWWRYDGTGSTVLYGGLITGGACDDHYGAGGISTKGKGVTVNLNNVTVAGNLADQYGSSYGHGGGIAVHGNDSCLTLKNSKVLYNHAEGYGGGIYVREDGTQVTIQTNSEVSNNLGVLHGGGIYIDDNSVRLAVENSKVNSNKTHDDGGGIYTTGNGLVQLWGAEVKYNYAQDKGGGVYYDGNSGSMIVRDKTCVSNNTAAADGGGIYHNGKGGYVNVYGGSYISGNSAVNGGGIYSFYDDTSFTFTGAYLNSNTASASGGGLYANDDAVITFEKASELNYNTAANDGGGVFMDDKCTLNIDASNVSYNKAGGHGGGIVGGKFSFKLFDKIYINMKNGACVSYNEAGKENRGGGIYLYNCDPTLSSDGTGLVTCNKAGYGGGVYACPADEMYSQPDFKVSGLIVKDNTAWASGGGMYTAGATVLTDMTVINNKAGSWGGGIYVNYFDSSFSFVLQKKITVTSNIATDDNAASNIRLGYSATSSFQTMKGGSGSNALTADSRFGVTIAPWVGYGRKIIEGDDFFTNLGDDKWTDVVSVDWPSKFKIKKGVSEGTFSDTPYLYTIMEEEESGGGDQDENKVTVTVYGNSDGTDAAPPETIKVDKNSLVTLNSSNYPRKVKVGEEEVSCPLVSWTLEFKDGDTMKTKTLTPDKNDGSVKFTPSQDVTVRANYAQAVVGVSATLADGRSWDDLSNGDASKVSSLVFTTSDGVRHEATSEQLAGLQSTVTAEQKDGKKKLVTCSLTVPKETIEAMTGNAALTSESFLKLRSALFSSSVLGDYAAQDVDAALASYNDCTLTLTFAVEIQGDYTVSFDANYGSEVASQAVKPGQMAKYPGKSKKRGYVFQGWALKDAVDDAASTASIMSVAESDGDEGGTEGDGDASGADGTPNVDLYDFTTPVTSDIELVALWEQADDPDYIDPDDKKPEKEDEDDADDDYCSYAQAVDVELAALAAGDELPSSATAVLKDAKGVKLATVAASLSWATEDGKEVEAGTKAVAGQSYVVSAKLSYSISPYVWYASGAKLTFNGQDALSQSISSGGSKANATFAMTVAGSFEGATVELPKASYAYTGSAICPVPVVTAYGKELTEGTDYELSYVSNELVGTPTVVVTGKGAYSGVVKASFTIVPAKVKGVAAKAAGKGKVKVSWTKHKAQTGGFQVRYAASKAKVKAGKGIKTAKAKGAGKTSKAVKALKSGKKYYFQVRAYKVVNGVTYCSAWSKVKAAKVK